MRGFTLLELMIVMALGGIAAISIAVSLGKKASGEDTLSVFFSNMLEEHYMYALDTNRPAKITGFKGSSGILKADGGYVTIPGVLSIQSAFVNENPTGSEYYINVYPDKLCDYFELETDSGSVIRSIPLLMSVEAGDKR